MPLLVRSTFWEYDGGVGVKHWRDRRGDRDVDRRGRPDPCDLYLSADQPVGAVSDDSAHLCVANRRRPENWDNFSARSTQLLVTHQVCSRVRRYLWWPRWITALRPSSSIR